MKILVCGGRDFGEVLGHETWAYGFLDAFNMIHGVSCVVHGDARGADKIAGKWASMRKIPFKTYPAAWDKHGDAAGPIRNQLMLRDNPDIQWVIAFPGGAGTADMVSRARAAGIEVIATNSRNAK